MSTPAAPTETTPSVHRGLAVVTAASRGIGAALALRLARGGYAVACAATKAASASTTGPSRTSGSSGGWYRA